MSLDLTSPVLSLLKEGTLLEEKPMDVDETVRPLYM